MERKQLSKVFFTLCLMLLSGIQEGFAQGTSEYPTGINPNPTDIKLEPSSLNLRIHEKARLKATVQPSGANQDVTWEVEEGSNVVSVDKTGLVNAKAVGKATVVVTSTVNTLVSKECTVTVRNPVESDVSKLNNLIYIEKQDLHPGTTATLSFQMKNNAAIRGFQFDMYLPEGISVVKNSNGRIMAELNPQRLPDDDVHTLTIQEQADGGIRFLCSSLYDNKFDGTSGEIATLKVTIAENVQDGNYPIIITDMKLTETDINNFYETPYLMTTMNVSSYILGDVNRDGKVDVSDYTGVANHIMGMPQEGFVKQAADVDGNGKIDVSDYTGIANFIMKGFFSGKSSLRKSRRLAGIEDNYLYVQDKELQKNAKKDVEVTLTISMKNVAPIRGFQFDMYLPEGISVVRNNSGRIMAKLNSERLPEDDQHTLTVQEQEGGAIRFLCSSLYDETFTENDGGLLTLQVNISKDLDPGEYKVFLRDMKLTETDISKFYEAEEVEFSIKVMDGDAIHDIRAAEEEGVIYDLSGKAVSNSNQQGVIIVNGKKIVNK